MDGSKWRISLHILAVVDAANESALDACGNPLFRAATTPPPTTVAAAQGDGTPRRGDVASPMVPPMAPPTSQLGAASNRGALPLSGREQALTLLRQLATVMPVGADVAAALATAVAGEGEDATCGHLDGDSLGSVGSSCAWILKSVDMSRGRGITISDDLQTILKRCAAKDFRLIVQRYVERPLLVRQRKFDIRQWVLVTSVNPLVVWMYSNYYLRFSSKEYTTGDLADAEVHLTNQSVQKHSTEYGAAVESNMWSKQQFVAHLSDELGGADAGRAAARSIDEQMRRAVGVALRSTCDIIEHRRNSFELFGFDFLIDADHGVWLLEANSSPDMSTNAAPLRQIVHDGLDDLLTLVIGLKRKRTPVKQLAAERAARRRRRRPVLAPRVPRRGDERARTAEAPHREEGGRRRSSGRLRRVSRAESPKRAPTVGRTGRDSAGSVRVALDAAYVDPD